jgi:hypothetical protein
MFDPVTAVQILTLDKHLVIGTMDVSTNDTFAVVLRCKLDHEAFKGFDVFAGVATKHFPACTPVFVRRCLNSETLQRRTESNEIGINPATEVACAGNVLTCMVIKNVAMRDEIPCSDQRSMSREGHDLPSIRLACYLG